MIGDVLWTALAFSWGIYTGREVIINEFIPIFPIDHCDKKGIPPSPSRQLIMGTGLGLPLASWPLPLQQAMI